MDDSETGTQDSQDLDSILNEYDSKTQPPQPVKDNRLDKMAAYIDRVEAEQEKKRIDESVARLIGESNIDRDLAYGYLVAQATKDKSIDKAFTNSAIDPDGWNKVLDKLGEDLRGKFPSIDEKATKDTEEMVSAVTGSKHSISQPDEAPDYSKMSDAEFNQEMQKLGI